MMKGEGEVNRQNEQPLIPQNEQQVEQVEDTIVNDDVQLGPGQEAQLEAYKNNATLVVFSEESQPSVLQWLQEGDNPIENVAKAAFRAHRSLEASFAKNQDEKMTEITLCLGAAHLVSELIVLADAAGLYKLDNDQRLEAYRHAIMSYFKEGLRDGTIDVVELQKTIEPLMNKEQKAFGLQQMEERGISKTAPPSAMKRGGSPGILGGAENVV